jgi:hypothetical protein
VRRIEQKMRAFSAFVSVGIGGSRTQGYAHAKSDIDLMLLIDSSLQSPSETEALYALLAKEVETSREGPTPLHIETHDISWMNRDDFLTNPEPYDKQEVYAILCGDAVGPQLAHYREVLAAKLYVLPDDEREAFVATLIQARLKLEEDRWPKIVDRMPSMQERFPDAESRVRLRESRSRLWDEHIRKVLSLENDRWDEGAKKFGQFLVEYKESMPAPLRRVGGFFGKMSRGREELEMLAWLCVGEKPAFFETSNAPSVRTIRIFERMGMRVAKGFRGGWFVYDPIRVQRVIDANRDVFESFGARTASEVVDKLTRTPLDRESRARGLVLGFPRSAVDSYHQNNPLGEIRDESAPAPWRSHVAGFRWTDYSGEQKQSEQFVARLRYIWRKKGIESLIESAVR